MRVRSYEPCASARSKPRPFAQARSARSRETSERALPSRERPPWRPITSASSPCSSSSCSVCAYSRAVISTVSPRARSRAISGANTGTCGELVMSTQTRMALYSRAVPVYWKQRYASRNQRHRAWVKRQAAREEALRRTAGRRSGSACAAASTGLKGPFRRG